MNGIFPNPLWVSLLQCVHDHATNDSWIRIFYTPAQLASLVMPVRPARRAAFKVSLGHLHHHRTRTFAAKLKRKAKKKHRGRGCHVKRKRLLVAGDSGLRPSLSRKEK